MTDIFNAKVPNNFSFIGKRNHSHRVSAISNSSESSSSSVESSVSSGLSSEAGGLGRSIRFGSFGELKVKCSEIERNDSGVGSDTSSNKSSFKLRRAFVKSHYKSRSTRDLDSSDLNDLDDDSRCFDCNLWIEKDETRPDRVSGIVCARCAKRRSERKEIITELYETEIKYGRDLRIIVEEFYRPMLVAGLLNSDQLAGIFLNAEELIQVNACFGKMLKNAIDEAFNQDAQCRD